MSKNIFIQGAISPEKIAESIARHPGTTGGHSLFLGQVRADIIRHLNVTAIEYTAYEALALSIFRDIKKELMEQYPLTNLCFYHSLGRVKVGEICLLAATAAPNRQPAISACNALVERIKKDLPVWGKELFENQQHQWKENK